MSSSSTAVDRGLLDHAPADFIGGAFRPLATGEGIRSCDPAAPDTVVWSADPNPAHVDEAIAAARAAQPDWYGMGREAREAALGRWKKAAEARRDRLASLITLETGKIASEADAEAGLVGVKVDVTLGSHSSGRIEGYEVAAGASRVGRCVFKPSDKTPAVGQAMAELAAAAELPPGVVNVVQGAAAPAAALASHDDVDGVLFTGSWPVGRRILEANLDDPGRIVALELGGSNPTVVMPDADLRQAVVESARAAFATTGQRCTCTRRIVLHKDVADRFIPAFCKVASTLLVGPGDSAAPAFMGPLISAEAVDAVLAFQDELHARGGKVLVQATRLERPGHFITPGVVLVDRFERDHDRECFGPLVQLAIADDLDDCITQANATRYGLAAAIFTRDDAVWDRFLAECRSGCINRNCGTAGASGQLPFGGLGHSGNHRPAGAFSVDYCAYPVASMVEAGDGVSIPAGMLLEDRWLEG